jgi:Uncharacterized protein conserved in bacteria
MPFIKTTSTDFWVDDVNSNFYNSWQIGSTNNQWNSAEKLLRTKDILYDYAMVINYNINPIIPGKGSAIFMHIWRGKYTGTAGCTAMPKKTMLKIMKWLNPNKNPIIIEGPISEVLKY